MADLAAFLRRFVSSPSLVGSKVRALRLVRQSPCCEDPDVPKATIGEVQDVDEDDVRVWVDFGGPYGTVLCDPDELERM